MHAAAPGGSRRGPAGLAVLVHAILVGGAVGVLAASVATPGLPRGPSLFATGTTGSLAVDPRGRYLWLRARGRTRLRVFLRDRRGLRAQLAEFVDVARGRRAPSLPPQSTRQDLAVVLAAYRSLETGRVVVL